MQLTRTLERAQGESTAPQKVGLLVVHGIGEQKPGTTRDSVARGLEIAYGGDTFRLERGTRIRDFAGPSSPRVTPSREVRIYEVYWKEVLSGDRVHGSFRIRLPQQLVWFPYLNWRYVRNFAPEYSLGLVLGWTAILVPLAAVLTAAYYALDFIFFVIQRFLDRPRESTLLHHLARRYRHPKMLGALLAAVRKDRSHRTRTLLNSGLDNYVADVFNYVDAAGNADPFVPHAAPEIYQAFRETLSTAVADGCSEIQILGHSLGSVITYHALTKYRSDTERLLCLESDANRADRPNLTHVYSIGCPLEKFRFFWPKLIEGYRPAFKSPAFRWHNFKSPLDIVAGRLTHYDEISKVDNHTITGAWGLFTAHTSYRTHPAFLRVIGQALTGHAPPARVARTPRLRKVLAGVFEAAWFVFSLGGLAAVGLLLMYGLGWSAGQIFSLAATSIRLPPSSTGSLTRLLADWTPVVLTWSVLVLLIPVALLDGYAKATQRHEAFWREGFALVRREEVPADNASPYKDLRSYGPLVGQILILAAVAWVGFRTGPGRPFSRSQAWLLIMGLMAVFALVAGRGITGYWRGILIDARYKMSLSRLQLLVWTLVVLSAIVTAALTNDAYGSATPLRIAVPPELWVLLGISTASAVAGPALLSTKRDKVPDPLELKEVTTALKDGAQVKVDRNRSGVILYNAGPEYARWGDLLKGDESGNASTVDLGKLQMFFFTFVLVLGYGATIVRLFDGSAAVAALPAVDQSLNTLLGISHTGYLANKAVPHSREKGKEDDAAKKKEAKAKQNEAGAAGEGLAS